MGPQKPHRMRGGGPQVSQERGDTPKASQTEGGTPRRPQIPQQSGGTTPRGSLTALGEGDTHHPHRSPDPSGKPGKRRRKPREPGPTEPEGSRRPWEGGGNRGGFPQAPPNSIKPSPPPRPEATRPRLNATPPRAPHPPPLPARPCVTSGRGTHDPPTSFPPTTSQTPHRKFRDASVGVPPPACDRGQRSGIKSQKAPNSPQNGRG